MTPRPVPPGAMLLQPTEERRRSGSHYTPRSLTEPIVRTTLRPVLEAFGPRPRPEQILGLNVCDPAMGSGAFLVETCRFLADQLVEAWQLHDEVPAIPPDEDAQLYARRLVAQRCIYGVDRNPFAVDLAKLSLWLVTLAKDHPFTFVDHTLRQGDSLVGFTREQIASFDWEKQKQLPIVKEFIGGRVREAERLREEIESLADSDDTREKLRLLRDADDAVSDVRLIGDALVAAFFGAAKDRARKELRKQYDTVVQAWLSGSGERGVVEEIVAELRSGERPVTPFHWDVEFPEIFAGADAGFDAFVGNPPFMGGTWISGTLGSEYLSWLKGTFPGGGSRADLVAYFFRQTFAKGRSGSCFGLVATNSVAQGDTRSAGLRWICTHGGDIYSARKRVSWPGLAAVIVSAVHVKKGMWRGIKDLDDRKVDRITAFLFHSGSHDDPTPLVANRAKSFKGVDLLGMGFTFDPHPSSEASTMAEMHEILLSHPEASTRIKPYIGGEEINTSPIHAFHRYAIDLSDLSETEARNAYPALIDVVEKKVRPSRMALRDHDQSKYLKQYWWKFNRPRPELREALAGKQRVLACSQVSAHHQFAFLDTNILFANYVIVFPLEGYPSFCALQCRSHEVWVRFFGSSMKDDLRYTPSDCFETFPFPQDWETHAGLDAAGKVYYEFRADLMVRNNEGLTATYNRFHDPNERSADILRLRKLHDEMDRAVLDAYGWTDLQPTCEFLLDYEDDDDEEEQSSRRRKKPWRYRWPDEFRDEVVARLLELNRQRAIEEGQVLPDATSPTAAKTKAAKAGSGRKTPPSPPSLFD